MDLSDHCNVHGGGEGVVAALGHVDVIVRVDRSLTAKLSTQQLDGSVGDDFVGVHVGLSPTARLPDDEGEMFLVQAAGYDLVSCTTLNGTFHKHITTIMILIEMNLVYPSL